MTILDYTTILLNLMFVVFLFFTFFLCNTFHSYLSIQSYARQLNILINRTAALDVYSVLKSRLISDWLVENMKPK